jgi:hypothetical protein
MHVSMTTRQQMKQTLALLNSLAAYSLEVSICFAPQRSC